MNGEVCKKMNDNSYGLSTDYKILLLKSPCRDAGAFFAMESLVKGSKKCYSRIDLRLSLNKKQKVGKICLYQKRIERI